LPQKPKPLMSSHPLLFDLTALQKEANTRLSLTAEETLNMLKVYEKKFIRTGVNIFLKTCGKKF
jgi:DNA topoisomerase IA